MLDQSREPRGYGSIPVFAQRGRSTFYRSMLRAEVIKLDLIKPPRTFCDKSEWTATLEALASAGKLEYIKESDSIKLPCSGDSTA